MVYHLEREGEGVCRSLETFQPKNFRSSCTCTWMSVGLACVDRCYRYIFQNAVPPKEATCALEESRSRELEACWKWQGKRSL